MQSGEPLQVESLTVKMKVATFQGPPNQQRVHEEWGFKTKEEMFEAMLQVSPELRKLKKALRLQALKNWKRKTLASPDLSPEK